MSDACCGPDEHHNNEPEADQRFWQIPEIRLAGIAGILLLGGFVAGWLDWRPGAIGLHLAAAAIGGWTFVPGTLRALRKKRIGVGTLMTIALVGALVLGQFAEAAMLAFLFSISEALEDYSLTRTRRGLRALLALVPEEVRVVRAGRESTIAPSELRIGDRMLVRAGERIASDGTVLNGRSAVDTSAITGESVPVETGPGDDVYAGAINGTGVLTVEATATVADNSLAKVVRVVEDAQRRKGDRQRLADRIARPLVPAVMVLAVLIAGLGALFGDPVTWVERALVVLVAAAPCAMAISVPVTVIAAVGAASRFGVLVKGGAALEVLGTVRTVALDKTGTLSRNRPVVTEVVPADGVTEARVLEVAAALEAQSEHPLAAAILAASGSPIAADSVVTVPGAGLEGVVSGAPARLGKPTWIGAGPLEDAVARLEESGTTVAVVEHDGVLLGLVGIRDELRPEAAEVVTELREAGVEVAMLTGDNARTAAALATQAGIEQVYAELKPTDKADLVRSMQGRRGAVAMVGDGVNDAPGLATADVGIAMGAMGSDVAIETADVALMGTDLRHLPQALRHARRARGIMLQNIGLSAVIVLTLVPLAAFGVLSLATVVFVHELAEVFVIGNGVRAGRLRPLRGETAPEPVAIQQIPVGAESEEDGCACCAPGKEESAAGPQMLTLAPTARDEPRRADRS